MLRVRGAVAVVRRRWWVVALLALLVAVGSLVQYFGPGAAQRESYVATRSLRIVVVPLGASTAYDGYVAARQEDEIAQTLASGGVLGSAQLDADVARRMHIDPRITQLGALNISAAHSGNIVTLTVRGRSPNEANTRASAVTETLNSTTVAMLLPPSLRPLSSPSSSPSSSETLLVQAEGSANPPIRDTARVEAAVWQMATRIALALVAGVFVALLLEWRMSSRRSHAPRLA